MLIRKASVRIFDWKRNISKASFQGFCVILVHSWEAKEVYFRIRIGKQWVPNECINFWKHVESVQKCLEWTLQHAQNCKKDNYAVTAQEKLFAHKQCPRILTKRFDSQGLIWRLGLSKKVFARDQHFALAPLVRAQLLIVIMTAKLHRAKAYMI